MDVSKFSRILTVNMVTACPWKSDTTELVKDLKKKLIRSNEEIIRLEILLTPYQSYLDALVNEIFHIDEILCLDVNTHKLEEEKNRLSDLVWHLQKEMEQLEQTNADILNQFRVLDYSPDQDQERIFTFYNKGVITIGFQRSIISRCTNFLPDEVQLNEYISKLKE